MGPFQTAKQSTELHASNCNDFHPASYRKDIRNIHHQHHLCSIYSLTLNYHNKIWANNTTWHTVYVAVSLLLLLTAVLLGNACYHSFQNLLSPCDLNGSLRAQIYIIFLAVLTYRSFATTVSQLKISDFSGGTFKAFEVL